MTPPNFVNRTIWTGDNLDILRGLNSETVDLIYLDPPFNSDKNYAAPVGSKAAGAAFKDTWTLSDLDVAWTGYIADEHLSGAGMAHGKGMQSYLTMMAVRLLELHRLLKPTGSIWLHCDPTASHYLKQLMDAVFGYRNYRNEVIWRRTGTHNDARHSLPDVSDTLLFYSRQDAELNPQHLPHSQEYIADKFRYDDNDGRGPYQRTDITSPQPRPLMMYDWRGYPFPDKGWRYQRETMQQLHDDGRIHYPKRPRRKRYLAESKGPLLGNVWADIPPLNSQAIERTGYPTQKPLALLDRIIELSSNPGDVVLDPFCGCATACVAAEKLGRQWLGVDLSSTAVRLVNERLQREMGDLFHWGFVTSRGDVPQRTDIDAPVDYRTHKHVLYGEQEGHCAGCRVHFEFRNLTVDHVIPKSKGGSDHKTNLQLLCGHCNSVKGNRPMEYLLAQLADTAVLVG